MGRRGDFAEKPKKGPGRKAKKQQDPKFPGLVEPALENGEKKLSSRQKKRLKKREEKKVKKVELKTKEESEEGEEEEIEEEDNPGFTDDNKEWLKPKGQKRKLMESDESEDDIPADDFEEEDDDSDATNEDDSGDNDDDEDEDDSGDDDDDEGEDDELPVEKAAKRLKKKQAKLEKDAVPELKLNFAEQEIFQLPSGQEIEQVKLAINMNCLKNWPLCGAVVPICLF